jgi:hypothetical protein
MRRVLLNAWLAEGGILLCSVSLTLRAPFFLAGLLEVVGKGAGVSLADFYPMFSSISREMKLSELSMTGILG